MAASFLLSFVSSLSRPQTWQVALVNSQLNNTEPDDTGDVRRKHLSEVRDWRNTAMPSCLQREDFVLQFIRPTFSAPWNDWSTYSTTVSCYWVLLWDGIKIRQQKPSHPLVHNYTLISPPPLDTRMEDLESAHHETQRSDPGTVMTEYLLRPVIQHLLWNIDPSFVLRHISEHRHIWEHIHPMTNNLWFLFLFSIAISRFIR